MFAPDNAVRVYLATGATDMRKSINDLSILIADCTKCTLPEKRFLKTHWN